ncbi:MAG: nucleotidyltransferase family protein [Proteobacteria bacterium]|nr:nucleotidyltransferase family protein [Pseudomonadota bacterium]
MKVMLLAAGVGERMRPLTNHTPKPLLRVAGMPLIEHHIRRLAEAGLTELVINVSHLAQQIMDYCDDGNRWGVSITYSPESQPLETAGGIINAMPLLDAKPFMVVNADVWTDYPFAQLAAVDLESTGCDAHLVLVDNPSQHPLGDFSLNSEGRLALKTPDATGYTYAGLGLYSPAFFAGAAEGKLAMRPLLDKAIPRCLVCGEYFRGEWADVGTPQRLQELDEMVSSAN